MTKQNRDAGVAQGFAMQDQEAAAVSWHAWVAGAIWTLMVVAAVLTANAGDLARVPLSEFAGMVVLWLVGTLVLAGGFRRALQRNREWLQALRVAEERSRLLYADAPVACHSIDAEGRILSVNDAWLTLFGYTREEVVGQPIGGLLGPNSMPADPARLSRAAAAGRTPTREVVYPRKDGSEVMVDVSAQVVHDAEGNLERAHCALHDITARKQAEAAVQASNARLGALIAHLHVGVLVEDAERRVVLVNGAFCELFGLRSSPAALQGRGGAEIARQSASLLATPEGYLERIEQAFTEGRLRSGELLEFADGRSLERDYVPIADVEAGRGHLWVFRDVTERRRMQQALEKRLVALTRPTDGAEGIEFDDLFDLEEIQKLQDQFAQATGVASIITRPDGTPITRPSNFTHLCAGIIRGTEKGRGNCLRSDAILGRRNPDGPIIQQCLSGGLWDAGASIVVGGRHIANWLIGQVRNEAQNEDGMRAYAREIGVEEESFIEAFRRVPCMSRQRFEEMAQTLFTLSQQLSATAYQNVQQARFIVERNRAEEALRWSEEQYRATINALSSHICVLDEKGLILTVNQAWRDFAAANQTGASNHAEGANYLAVCDAAMGDDAATAKAVAAGVRAVIGGEQSAYSIEYPCHSPTEQRWFYLRATRFAGDGPCRVVMAHENITERRRFEEALRASEEHFRLSIEHAGAGYFRINRERCYESVNPAWLDMHGLTSAEQILGRHFGTTQLEEDRAAAEQIVEEAFAGREFRTGEFTRKIANGTVGSHTFSLQPVREKGEVVALEGFLIDTTSLRRAMADYRMLFDSMLDGFALHEIICDAAGQPVDYRFLAINPAFERQTGLKVDNLIGRTVREALPQTEQKWIETAGRVALSGQPVTFESFSASLNRWFKVSAFCPAPRQFACVFVDITARKSAEDELRKLSRAVEQSPVSVVITDVAGSIEYTNPHFTTTTGYTLDEVRGKNPRLLSSGETPPDTYVQLWQTISGGREWHGEFRNRRKDGTLFWEAVTIGPILGEDGRITHFVAVKADITGRKRAETALAASERRFRSLVENVPNIAVQGYDLNRRVIFWNAASETLYGYTQAEALGRQLEDLIIPAEMRGGVIAAIEGLFSRNEQIPAGELVLRRKDGSAVSVYSSHAKLERADGEAEMHCIDIDLTARKEAERALVESHDFHLRMLSQAPALIWRAGTDGKCNWFNATWLAFTGRALEQEIGDGWTEGVHPDDLERCVGIYQTAFSARRPFEMEYRLRRHDGEFRWISDNGIPFISFAGEFGGFIGYCYDLTERRRADEQIREQAALLDVTDDAILVVDLERTVTYWNRGAERMYEIPAADARGRKLEELLYREIPPDYHAGWLRLPEVGEWRGDRRHTTRSGREIDVRIRSRLVRNAKGQPTSVLVVGTNVTESKQLEKQFLRAQRLESLGALASGVAHDLNNVLTPILMSVELLRPIAHEKHDQDMLQLLSDSARRGSDIVQQLLLFGRGSDTPRSPMNAGSIVKDVGRMMRETFPKSITLSVQAPADLRLVDADRTQLHQVVLNLCVNARDAMPQGGRLTATAENVEVEKPFAQTHSGTRTGPHVRIRVQDTGNGIAPEILEKIFDPFFTTKPVGQGTGLGLATVLGIVRSHEGIVDVTSAVGRGSTFDVYLPALAGQSQSEPMEGPQETLRGFGELVLVIEDEEGIRGLLQRALTEHNYQVLVACDGVEALGIFAQNAGKVNLVVTDAMMPVMDGAQTIRALRRLNPQLPVVAISGLPAQQAELAKNPGPPVRFLPKPFSTEHALRLIREALDPATGNAPNP